MQPASVTNLLAHFLGTRDPDDEEEVYVSDKQWDPQAIVRDFCLDGCSIRKWRFHTRAAYQLTIDLLNGLCASAEGDAYQWLRWYHLPHTGTYLRVSSHTPRWMEMTSAYLMQQAGLIEPIPDLDEVAVCYNAALQYFSEAEVDEYARLMDHVCDENVESFVQPLAIYAAANAFSENDLLRLFAHHRRVMSFVVRLFDKFGVHPTRHRLDVVRYDLKKAELLALLEKE